MRVTHIFKTYTVICIPASPLNTTFSDTKHRDSFQKTIYWSFHVGFPGENLGSVSSSLTLIWANWPIIPTPECLVAFWGHFPHYGRPPPRSNSSIFLVHDHPSQGITAKSQASMPPKTYIYIYVYVYIYVYPCPCVPEKAAKCLFDIPNNETIPKTKQKCWAFFPEGCCFFKAVYNWSVQSQGSNTVANSSNSQTCNYTKKYLFGIPTALVKRAPTWFLVGAVLREDFRCSWQRSHTKNAPLWDCSWYFLGCWVPRHIAQMELKTLVLFGFTELQSFSKKCLQIQIPSARCIQYLFLAALWFVFEKLGVFIGICLVDFNDIRGYTVDE